MRKPATVLSCLLTTTALAQNFEAFDIPVLDQDSTDSRSVALLDLNTDGRLDVFFTNSSHENARLYLSTPSTGWEPGNAGDLTSSGGRSDGASFADADGDGDLDAAIVNWYGEANQLFRNDGSSGFTRIDDDPFAEPGTYSETCSWADVNADGWLDLYVSNSAGSLTNSVYLNLGGTQFGFTEDNTSELVQWGGHSRAVAFGDWNLDGLVDLLVTNEGTDANHPFLQINGGDWELDFTSALYSDTGNTMTASWGDVDNDGDPDLFIGNHGQTDRLYRVAPQGLMVLDTLSAFLPSAASFGSAFGDFDNDGDLDLFVTQGWSSDPSTGFTDVLYRNEGGVYSVWADSALASSIGWSYGCGVADLDADGQLDIAVARWQGEHQPNRLWRNRNTTGNWLQLDLSGDPPNTTALGARIVCHSRIEGEAVVQTRWVEGQSGYCGQVLRQHFGLGDATGVDSLLVYWPDGTIQRMFDLPVNTLLTIEQGGGHSGMRDRNGVGRPAGLELHSPFPNPFNGQIRIGWTQAAGSRIQLDLLDISGRQILRIAEGFRRQGTHSISLDAGELATGLYFVRLASADFWATRKVLHFK